MTVGPNSQRIFSQLLTHQSTKKLSAYPHSLKFSQNLADCDTCYSGHSYMTGCHSATTKLAHGNGMYLSNSVSTSRQEKKFNQLQPINRLFVLALYEIFHTSLSFSFKTRVSFSLRSFSRYLWAVYCCSMWSVTSDRICFMSDLKHNIQKSCICMKSGKGNKYFLLEVWFVVMKLGHLVNKPEMHNTDVHMHHLLLIQ